MQACRERARSRQQGVYVEVEGGVQKLLREQKTGYQKTRATSKGGGQNEEDRSVALVAMHNLNQEPSSLVPPGAR